jgi:arylsulfatase A-like enzyme
MNHSRRHFITIAAAFLCIIGFNHGTRAAESPPTKPNIILIVADDMGFSDIGCFGSEINTPNIDKLASTGVRCTQFYNNARCCPSRAALMTGLYPHAAGMGWMSVSDLGQPGYIGELNDRCITIAQALKPAGYQCYMSGKWHLVFDKNMAQDSPKNNWPLQRGFDHYYGGLAGDGGYYKPLALTRDNTRIEAPDQNYYYTDAITENAVQFVNDHYSAHASDPFFMAVAYYAPHRPLQAKAEDIAKYKGKYTIGWDAARDAREKRQAEMHLFDTATGTWDLSPRDPSVQAWANIQENMKPLWDMRMATYAAMIDCMDQGIGRILAALDKNKGTDNTVIFFISDNGACAEVAGNNNINTIGTPATTESYRVAWANASNTPFRLYKSYVHEGGISSPLIINWPKGLTAAKGSITKTISHVIDLMPTCLDLAGATYPKQFAGKDLVALAGVSLVPMFAGKDVTREEDALYFEHEANRAIRKGKWKLVSRSAPRPPYTGPWELYDLERDRSELHDLAAQNPDLVEELSTQWDTWAKQNNVYPLDARGWNQKIQASKR